MQTVLIGVLSTVADARCFFIALVGAARRIVVGAAVDLYSTYFSKCGTDILYVS